MIAGHIIKNGMYRQVYTNKKNSDKQNAFCLSALSQVKTGQLSVTGNVTLNHRSFFMIEKTPFNKDDDQAPIQFLCAI